MAAVALSGEPVAYALIIIGSIVPDCPYAAWMIHRKLLEFPNSSEGLIMRLLRLSLRILDSLSLGLASKLLRLLFKLWGPHDGREEPVQLLRLKEFTHSMPLWGLGGAAFLLLFANGYILGSFTLPEWAAAFCVGMGIHAWTDMLTHSDMKWIETDTSGLWPFRSYDSDFKLGQWLGVWEYRIDREVFGFKPFEKWFFAGLTSTFVTSTAYHIAS